MISVDLLQCMFAPIPSAGLKLSQVHEMSQDKISNMYNYLQRLLNIVKNNLLVFEDNMPLLLYMIILMYHILNTNCSAHIICFKLFLRVILLIKVLTDVINLDCSFLYV